jgi:phage host-nuclease inhibitor protein Gam
MARVKMEEKEKIQNWEEADLVLKEIAELNLQKDILENKMNEHISDVKLEFTDKAEPIHKRIKVLSNELKTFTNLNRNDLRGKTKKMNFGSLGYRKSTKLSIPHKIKNTVIALLKRKNMNDCINVKETINKEVLKTYDNIITELGVIKKVTDTFWYEVDKEKLID